MSYDITFCPNEKCNKLDCERHYSHHPIGVPFSVFAESQKKGDECKMYWPGWSKPDGRKVKK